MSAAGVRVTGTWRVAELGGSEVEEGEAAWVGMSSGMSSRRKSAIKAAQDELEE